MTKSEVLWSLKVVTSYISYNPSKELGEIFKAMFSENDVAKKLAIGFAKLSYLITFGLAPYIHEELLKPVE